MAYQNVGTPRFFIDNLLWLNSLGLGMPQYLDYNVFDLNPSKTITQSSLESSGHYWFQFMTTQNLYGLNYIAILNHNMANTHDFNIEIRHTDGTYGEYPMGTRISSDVDINGAWNGGTYPTYNGFSIMMSNTKCDITTPHDRLMFYNHRPESTWEVGCFSLGTTYEMPHSPDLKLTMTREMDGVKRIRTKGGADLVNYKYTKPSSWGDAGAWELYTGTPPSHTLARSGRRVWDLSFSYLQDSDVFAPTEHQGANILDTDGYVLGTDWSSPNYWSPNMRFLAHDDFYSQVIHKTNGGQLPFIFQPDKDNNNPDGFAIAKLDMKSFKFSQVANGVYNVKLKIREVW